jgi:hypothetical protein
MTLGSHVPDKSFLAFALFILMGSLYGTSQASTTSYQIPAQTWLKAYLSYLGEHNLKIPEKFDSPSIWLFSPAGEMVRSADSFSDPDLKKLSSEYPFDAHATALPGRPNLKQAREMLSGLLPIDPMRELGEHRWYAILFLSDSPDCKHCATYDQEMSALEKKASGQIDVVRITAIFPK